MIVVRRLFSAVSPFSVLPAILVVASIWPAQVLAENTETNPTDPSAAVCVNAYYGVGEAVDYVKAYKCFDGLNTYQMLILMQLNGQGVPANLGKGRALMNEWRKLHPDLADDGLFPDGGRILRILGDNKEKYPPTPPLSYCKDVASSDYEEGFCLRTEDDLEQQKSNKTFAQIRGKLAVDDARLWDQVIKAFEEYVDAEGLRADNQYYGGSGAPNANTSQRIYVRKDFMGLIQKVFIQRNLVPSSKPELAKSEGKMKAVFDADIAQYGTTSAPSSVSNVPADSDFDKKMEIDGAAAYKSAAIDSQAKWLVLRNLCAEFTVRFYKGRKPGIDLGISLDNMLTLDRTAIIKKPI